MGTPVFAAICLNHILESKHEVAAVISVPDKPSGRGQKMAQSAVTQLAIDKNLKLLQPEKLKNPEFIEELKGLNADAFVVVAFRMLPKEVWEIPAKGTFNLHASLLPQYRGAAPINWAIMNGETETGVTTFLIDEKIDTGKILLQDSVKIFPEDNAGTLHDKLAECGKKLIIKTLDGLENNELEPKTQLNPGNLKTAPKIFKEDCRINWNEDLEKIQNKIRGLSPYPAAWCYFVKNDEKKFVKIFKAKYDKRQHSNEKHQIGFEGNQILIYLKNGILIVEDLQIEGKKRMISTDFINGLQDKNHWSVA
jgi:methionyl-tRNA formyltransferase